VKSRFLLDIVVRKGATILQLLAGKNQALLIWGNSLLVLDLRLHVLDRVGRLHVKGDGFPSQRLHENLHATAQTQHQVKSRFLLDIVVRKRATILQLFAGKNQALLIRRNSLLVLDLCLHVLNCVGRLHIESDGFPSQRLHENLHATAQTQHQVKSRFLLDIVVRKGATILQLLAGKNQALLIWGNSLLVLDLRLHVLDRVGRLHVKGDGFPSQRLHENLHATAQTQHQVKSRFLLDIVVRKRATILQLLAGENQALLIRGNSLLVLDLCLHILDRVGRLHVKSDGFSCQCFHENLHTAFFSFLGLGDL